MPKTQLLASSQSQRRAKGDSYDSDMDQSTLQLSCVEDEGHPLEIKSTAVMTRRSTNTYSKTPVLSPIRSVKEKLPFTTSQVCRKTTAQFKMMPTQKRKLTVRHPASLIRTNEEILSIGEYVQSAKALKPRRQQ